MLSLIVAHGGQSYPVELPASSTIQELQGRLHELTSVPVAGQKLIHKGKNLAATSPTSSLSSLSIPSGARLLLVGSSSAAASAVAADHAALQRRYQLSQTRQAVKPRTTAEGGKMVMDLNSLRSSKTFERFGKIEVLPGCPHEELRRERLRKLSTDEAVLGGFVVYTSLCRGMDHRLTVSVVKSMHERQRLASGSLERAASKTRSHPAGPQQECGRSSLPEDPDGRAGWSEICECESLGMPILAVQLFY